jgi:tetratricopeptide (TPR) repeat protein
VVLLGPEFIGKREGLFRFYETILGDAPPLIVRFGSGGTGLSCITDALSPSIRSLIAEPGRETVLEDLDKAGTFIFKERLADEFSIHAVRKTGDFFYTLMENYITALKARGIMPVIVVENIHRANPAAARVLIEVCNSLVPSQASPGDSSVPADRAVFICGTGSEVSGTNGGPDPGVLPGIPPQARPVLGIWETLFVRVLRISSDDSLALAVPDFRRIPISKDLWEIAYGAALLRCYFPPALFLTLFKEQGKNPGMISRALNMLSSLGVIDFTGDPQPRMQDFFTIAEGHLGGQRDRIRSLVRDRLLAWVCAEKLRPSFNLLRALTDLGGIGLAGSFPGGAEGLILESLRQDLINGVYQNLHRAIEESCLADTLGPDHIPALVYIFRTLESLVHGNEGAIHAAFGAPPPEDEAPIYKARMLVNRAGYKLAIHETEAASDLIRESMLLSQRRPDGRNLAHAYRLFAMVNLSNRKLMDAIDYFSFAMEQSEKSGDPVEFILSAYYAAEAQFVFGNIARAERFTLKAEEAALGIGLPAWADRIKFARGKLRFECGRYRDALELFGELYKEPQNSLSPEAEAVLEAWLFRSAVFLDLKDIPRPRQVSADALLFEIEASYLAGDYRLTLELSDKLLDKLPSQDFLFIEQPDWRSGFAQGELLQFSQGEFLDPLVSSYRALALCRLDPSGPFGREAMGSMERIVQDERLYETDPNDAFYFYTYYQVLGMTGAGEVDMNTAISIAYKRLQRRASRIDDVELNRSFLTQHYWNGALSRAAKDHKLI